MKAEVMIVITVDAETMSYKLELQCLMKMKADVHVITIRPWERRRE